MNIPKILSTTLFDILLILLIPSICVFLLTLINRNTKQIIANTWGTTSQIYLGGLGIIIHETSHLVFALLFSHRVTNFKLLVMPWNFNTNMDRTLGYVNHTWNKRNLFQNLGNAFIGTAPIWGCTAVLIGLTKLLNPTWFQVAQTVSLNIRHYGLSLSILLNGFNSLRIPTTSILSFSLFFIWIVVSINITIGGFDLSTADFKSAVAATVELYLILSVLLFILLYFGLSSFISSILSTTLSWFLIVMFISFIWSIIGNSLSRICAIFFDNRK